MIEPQVRAPSKERIIFMDNDRRSIREEVSVAEELGFDVKVVPKVLALGNHLSELEKDDEADKVVAMVLDMAMPEKTLKDIELPHVNTGDGQAVGLAVAERFLRDGDNPFAEVPVAFLTGFTMSDDVRGRITTLKEGPQDAVILQKEREIPALKVFLKAARAKRRRKALAALKAARPAGLKRKPEAKAAPSQSWVEVATAARIIWELFDDPAERAGAFGHRSMTVATVADVERFAAEYPNVDLADRAALIIDMKMRLDALSGQRLDVQRKWLNGKPASLDGDRPVDLVCNGHLHDLKRVVGALRLVTG